MLAKWLQQERASWDQLLEALRSESVQRMNLANQIEQMLDTNGKSHGSVYCIGSLCKILRNDKNLVLLMVIRSLHG